MQYVLSNVGTNSAKTGTTATDSFIITGLANVTDLYVGQHVTGAGIPIDTSIVSIDSSSQITLSKKATASASTSLTFFTPVICLGDEPVIAVWGNFGGGTITFEGSPDAGVTWITLKKRADNTDATFTVPSFAVLYRIPQGFWIRALLTGASGASGIYAAIGM